MIATVRLRRVSARYVRFDIFGFLRLCTRLCTQMGRVLGSGDHASTTLYCRGDRPSVLSEICIVFSDRRRLEAPMRFCMILCKR